MRFRRRAMAWCVRSESRKARRSPRTGSSRRSSCADRRRLEEMPKALLLRSEVANVRRRGRHLERDAFRYVDAVRAEFLDLRAYGVHVTKRIPLQVPATADRKSTRLNSSHDQI